MRVTRVVQAGVFVVFGAVAAVVVAKTVPSKDWPLFFQFWLLIGAVLAAAFVTVLSAILLHEVSHAIVAGAIGYGIHSVYVWYPGPLLFIRILGVWMILGNFRGGGYCVAYPRKPVSRPSVLFPAAGPLANLLLGAVLFTMSWTVVHGGWERGWMLGAAAVNVALGIGNLLPFSFRGMDRVLLSDGALIVRAMSGDAVAIQEDLAIGYAWGLWIRDDLAGALRVLEEHVVARPGASGARLLLASALRAAGRPGDAKILFEALLAAETDPKVAAAVKGNFAVLLADPGPERNTARADALSAEALAVAPEATLLFCRGGILAMMGRDPEAAEHFERAWPRLLDPVSRGYVAAYLGIQAFTTGDAARARRWLRRADHHDGPTDLRKLLRERLAGRTPEPAAGPKG